VGEWVNEQTEGIAFYVPNRQLPGVLERNRKRAEARALWEHLDPRAPVHIWITRLSGRLRRELFFRCRGHHRGEITIPGLGRKSLQGDVRFAEVLADMGCELVEGNDAITVAAAPCAASTST